MSLRAIACWAFDEASCHLSLPNPRSTGTCVLRQPPLLHSCARSILPSFIATRTVHPSWYSSLRPGSPGFAPIPVRHPPQPACIRRSSLWSLRPPEFFREPQRASNGGYIPVWNKRNSPSAATTLILATTHKGSDKGPYQSQWGPG